MLAFVDGKASGCAELNPNDENFCELKRLYVRSVFRGLGISWELVEWLIEDARGIGYKHMRLDTFLFMTSANKLYEKFGFYLIARYNDNPSYSVIFL